MAERLPGGQLLSVLRPIGRQVRSRRLEQAAAAPVLGQQRFDFTPQFFIARAGFGEQRGPFIRRASQRGMKEPLDLLPAFSLHRLISPLGFAG
jgi:hypothetical protein